MFAFSSGLLIGLIIGTMAGMVSWVAAAAYLEARRTNPARGNSIAEAMAAATTAIAVGAESPVFSLTKTSPSSAERIAPAGQLFRRQKDSGSTITPTRGDWMHVAN